MNALEPTLRIKIQDIVVKLQKLECTLLGNKDDAWVMELLFKPGFHRYHLIEWMLSKLGYDTGKMSGPQNSAEERMKNLQSTVSDLGICKENSHNVIKGTAEVKEQLEFWCHLVDIICLKYEFIMNTSKEADEGVALSPEKSKRKCVYEEYVDASSCINKICESVNLKHLFQPELQLLSPDVQREIKNLSPSRSEACKIPILEELKESVKEYPEIKIHELCRTLLSEVSFDENEDDETSKLNELEEVMSEICNDFKKCAQSSFNDVYNELKPLILLAETDTFTDVGPAFKEIEPSLESLLQLKNSFSKIESSYSKLSKINSDLEALVNQDSLSDENYANISRLMKDEI